MREPMDRSTFKLLLGRRRFRRAAHDFVWVENQGNPPVPED
jgi:hypothetical protein